LSLIIWSLAGKVIGKKGLQVENLKRETHVSCISAMKPVGSSLWAAVVIMGPPEPAFAAYEAIAEIVENGNNKTV
jgi:hypothetical protein